MYLWAPDGEGLADTNRSSIFNRLDIILEENLTHMMRVIAQASIVCTGLVRSGARIDSKQSYKREKSWVILNMVVDFGARQGNGKKRNEIQRCPNSLYQNSAALYTLWAIMMVLDTGSLNCKGLIITQARVSLSVFISQIGGVGGGQPRGGIDKTSFYTKYKKKICCSVGVEPGHSCEWCIETVLKFCTTRSSFRGVLESVLFLQGCLADF